MDSSDNKHPRINGGAIGEKMKRKINKALSSLACFVFAYGYWFFAKDIPIFYTIGTAFREFLYELVTGKDLSAG